MEKWRSELDQIGVHIEVIDRMSVPEYLYKVRMVLFTDENEMRGSTTLIRSIYHKRLPGIKLNTYKGVWEKSKEKTEDKTFIENCLESLRKKGVHLFALQFMDNGSEYYHRLVSKDIPQKFIDENIQPSFRLPLSAMRDFFEEFYTEEYANVVARHPFKIEKFNGANRFKDLTGKYHNVKDGERLTVESPLEFERTIYFFGPCVIFGAFVEDKHTIESFLQIKCNNEGNNCRVVNLGCWDSKMGIIQRILSTPLKENDIIVMYLHPNMEIPSANNLNLTNVLEKNDAPAKWFVNCLWHCNHKVNKIYADAIYEAIGSVLEIPSCSGNVIDMRDQSVFTFDERFVLVHVGVSDLSNVMVVPSGQFILSQNTFPEYFIKVEDEDLVKNAEYDIMLFAEQIAPRLNITYRFVGEEPQDAVTNEYNQAMKRILPQKGIRVIEIPRKENDDGIISASFVRKCMEEDNRTKLKELIPRSTWEILFGEMK